MTENAIFISPEVPDLHNRRGYATEHESDQLGKYVIMDFGVGLRSVFCMPYEVDFDEQRSRKIL